jgi:HK97 family phage major capsid protein
MFHQTVVSNLSPNPLTGGEHPMLELMHAANLNEVQLADRRVLARRMLRNYISNSQSEWDRETREYVQEWRALSSAGGFPIPHDFMPEVDKALKGASGMFQAARIVQTENGDPMDWPKADDTGNVGELLPENTLTGDNADPVYGKLQLKGYVFSSKIVRVPVALIEDAGLDLEQDLFVTLGQRVARTFNPYATTGTGSSQPRGLITALLADTTPVAAASASAITYDDLVNLEHAIDPAYRNEPGMGWMFHYDVLKQIKKLKDANGHPIFKYGDGTPGRPNSLMGWPFFINQDMDNTIATGKETVVFGNFNHYIIRRAGPTILMRLTERYGEYMQYGFLLIDRLDGQLVMGGNKAIQVLQHP